MPYLDAYLQNIIDRGNLKLAESVKETAENVGNKYLKTFSFTEHKIGLLPVSYTHLTLPTTERV